MLHIGGRKCMCVCVCVLCVCVERDVNVSDVYGVYVCARKHFNSQRRTPIQGGVVTYT
jgi:hypothetical protein